MSNKPIFRSAALEQLRSPDHLDQLLQVTRPTGWIGLLACMLLLLTALVWGMFGSLAVNVSGTGVLLAPGGVRDVTAVTTGQLVTMTLAVGDSVAEGQVVAHLLSAGHISPTAIISPYAGRVVELQAAEGSWIDLGDPILRVSTAVDDQLEAFIYIPAAESGKIEPGLTVLLAPASVSQEEHGLLMGRVTSVGAFPASQQGILQALGSGELVAALPLASPVVEVRVALTADPQTASGYAWSSAQGSPYPLRSGTLCTAWIAISVQRPIRLLLPQ